MKSKKKTSKINNIQYTIFKIYKEVEKENDKNIPYFSLPKFDNL